MTDISKKQYLLSSCRQTIAKMQEIKVGKMYLYIGEKLNICECKTKDGKSAIIIGNAFCADRIRKSVKEDITNVTEKDIGCATRFWTGSWVLVTENTLFTDACGLISAFYVSQNNVWFVSSSLALLSEILGKSIDVGVNSEGLTWQILPKTIVDGVRALVCTQKVILSEEKIRLEPRIWISDERNLSTQEKCKRVSEMLVNAVSNIGEFSEKRIVVALTGGKDSRVTFSALLKSGVDFSAYTAEHDNISSSDRVVPQKLCDMFNKDYIYIKKSKFDCIKYNDYMHFCGKNANGADANFYACGQFDGFKEDTVIIRSGLYEAGQTYSREIAGGEPKSFCDGIMAYNIELQRAGKQRDAFFEWMSYVDENPIDYIDIRDRFYIEQRAGGWVSAIEQSLDINDFTSIQIANCEEILSILLSCNNDERNNLSLSYETINLLEPEVLKIAVNQRTITDKLLRVKGVFKNPVSKVKRFINKCVRR